MVLGELYGLKRGLYFDAGETFNLTWNSNKLRILRKFTQNDWSQEVDRVCLWCDCDVLNFELELSR